MSTGKAVGMAGTVRAGVRWVGEEKQAESGVPGAGEKA